MTSSRPGGGTSTVEVTHISDHGIWLVADGEELFLPYEEFPWFRGAPPEVIYNVQESVVGHYFWPDLDVDLGLDTIRHPERYPLKSRG